MRLSDKVIILGSAAVGAAIGTGCIQEKYKNVDPDLTYFLDAKRSFQRESSKSVLPMGAQTQTETQTETAFDDKDITRHSSQKKSRFIIDIHHRVSEDRATDSHLDVTFLQDLGNNWKVIGFGAGSYTQIGREVNDYFTKSGRFDARIAKYINMGQNVLAYVETGAGVEVFAYNNTDSDMQSVTGRALLRTGILRRKQPGARPGTKVQADVDIGAGPYEWDFDERIVKDKDGNDRVIPAGTIEDQILKVITQLQATQKLPFSINKVNRINVVATGRYSLIDHRSYLRQHTGSLEAGVEFELNKSVLGIPIDIRIYGGVRGSTSEFPEKPSRTCYFGRGGARVTAQLAEGADFYLGGTADAEYGPGAETGLVFKFGSTGKKKK